tara:strand:- start:31 stop:1068 length:1038 start_codon:yes stop_codon:yes gene_type:complete
MAVYTTIDDPSKYFQTVLYTGDGNDNRSITNDGNSNLQPDFIWIKNRSSTQNHYAYDSSRGANVQLLPHDSAAETTVVNRLQAFESDGFQVGSSSEVNYNTYTYVGWQWKVNGGTTSSNTDGNVTVTLQANTTAGFSIGTWTSNGNTSGTIGHGLGARPDILITKERNDSGNWNAAVPDYSTTQFGSLQNDIAFRTASGINTYNASTFKDGDGADGNTRVFYAFRSIQGYSKIGTYIGNGNTDGTFVYLGFKPAFLLLKKASAVADWQIRDNKRDSYNEDSDEILFADLADATATSTNNIADFLSNGFKLRGTGVDHNGSGATFIYMAFAESPFVTSTGIPATAR